jgi:hypothetical protein
MLLVLYVHLYQILCLTPFCPSGKITWPGALYPSPGPDREASGIHTYLERA